MAIYSIYKFTNLVNNKIYIGLTTTNPDKRKYAHERSAARGSMFPFHQAIRKYGMTLFTFEVICCSLTKENLGALERFFIKEYNCCRLDGDVLGYNLTRGGEGFDSEQAKSLISKRTAEGTNPWAGELGSRHAIELAARLKSEGRHPSQNPEWVEARANEVRERVANGTHHWLGDDWASTVSGFNKDRIADGTHPWMGEKGSKLHKERFDAGTHHFQKEHTCPHCGKIGKGVNMFKWHFDRCKRKIT